MMRLKPQGLFRARTADALGVSHHGWLAAGLRSGARVRRRSRAPVSNDYGMDPWRVCASGPVSLDATAVHGAVDAPGRIAGCADHPGSRVRHGQQHRGAWLPGLPQRPAGAGNERALGSQQVRVPRKASKYPFVNLLAANTWWKNRYTTPASLSSLFWRSDKHEIDFVRPGRPWIEVKAGKASPFEFDWFRKAFAREELLVINSERFDGGAIRGATLEDFLLDETM